MKCKRCEGELIRQIGGFSIYLMNGNEEILSVHLCPACNEYYMEGFEDVFIGEADNYIWVYGPFSIEKGEELIKQMKSCPDPRWNKYCDCPAHEYVHNFFYTI